jgi:hypothetical protein
MLKGCKKSFKKIWAYKLFSSFTEPRTEAKNVCDLLCYSPVIDGHGFRILEAGAVGV